VLGLPLWQPEHHDYDQTPDHDVHDSAWAERRGSGDGRVYHVAFVADDGRGGQCSGMVTACVPLSQKPGGACVDQGPLFDSLTEARTSPCDDLCTIEMAVGSVCSAE